MATKYTFKENVLRVVAVIGLIAVLLLGAWGIIQLAFFIPDFLSGLAKGDIKPTATETLTVSVPASVTSEQAFPVSWTHKNGSGEYSYALSYSCADGLSAKAPLPTGAAQTVACNTAFNYINASSTSPLIFTTTGKQSVPVNIKVTATKLSSGAASVSATAQTSVKPSATATAKPTTTKPTTTKPSSKPTTTYVASGRTTNLYGLPDLQVRILSNPGTVRAGAQIQLQFSVENVGTNVTPTNWSFIANLPYSPTYTFQSQGQQALYPGDKIVYTLTYAATPVNQTYGQGATQYNSYQQFTGWSYTTAESYWNYAGAAAYNQYGYGQSSTASVSVDPNNLVAETNKTNNYAAISYQVY